MKASPCHGETNAPVIIHIGVLAHLGKERCLSDWNPMAEYLNEKLSGYKFEIIPCNFQEIDSLARKHEIDFMLANAAIYVEMEVDYGLHRIATMISYRGELACNHSHGAILCLATNNSVKQLPDLKHKTIAAVEKNSFGGYAMQ